MRVVQPESEWNYSPQKKWEIDPIPDIYGYAQKRRDWCHFFYPVYMTQPVVKPVVQPV